MLIDEAAPQDKPETAQMIVIHKALRREFRLLPTLVEAVPDADTARARAASAHVDLLLAFLHAHHDSEDRLLWPLLEQRAPLSRDLVATMARQHQAVDELVEAIRPDLGPWASGSDTASRLRIAKQLGDLNTALVEHLDLEEAEVLPLIHAHVTVAEWERAERDGAKHMPRNPRPGLMLAGMVLEDATPREQAWFLRELPAPARLMWHTVGRSGYARYVRLIRTP